MTKESPKINCKGIPINNPALRRAQTANNSALVFVLLPHPIEKLKKWESLINITKPAPPRFFAAAPSKYPQKKLFNGANESSY